MLDLRASQHYWLFWNLTWPCTHYKWSKMKWNTGASHKKKYFLKTFENFASDASRIAQAPPQLSVLTQTLAKNLARLLLRLVTQAFPVNLSGTAKVRRVRAAKEASCKLLVDAGYITCVNKHKMYSPGLFRMGRHGTGTNMWRHIVVCGWKKRTHRQSHSRLRSLSWHTLRWPDRLAVIQRETWGAVRKIAPILPLVKKASTQVNFGLHHSFLHFFTL